MRTICVATLSVMLLTAFCDGALGAEYCRPAGELQEKAQALADLAVKEGLQGALQFCAFKDGKCIVDVWAGTMTTNAGAAKIDGDTLFPIFSTEKPLLATAVHRSAERGKLEYDKPVCKYWPEFRGGGKENLTVREMMGYRSGLPDCKPGIRWDDFSTMSDWQGMLEWYASCKPEIEPGTKQRYMPRSYGWALGGLLEKEWGRPANDILREQVLIPAGIEKDFYFVCGDDEIPRIAEAYNGETFETMNNDIARRSLLPSAWAVSSARGIAKFYNRLCGFDGQPPLISKSTLDAALKPCRHESDPLPDAEGLKKWHMIFGMGYGLWGESDDISRVFGHGGVGGSEGLCDRSQKLVIGYTCNFDNAPPKLREAFYSLVGMRWRYWKDDVNIQDLQMATVAKGNDASAGSVADIVVDGSADVRVSQDVVTVTSTGAVSFVRLKMGESLAPEMKVLNDAWERSYGNLEWQTLGEKTIYSPWYFLAEKDGKVQGFGVETGPGAMCCWEVSAKGVTLVLDVRAGGGPVRLNGRTLKACRIVRAESKAGESPWQFGRRFCRMMCPKPKLPKAPVYGYNDWYCAYGKNTATNFLADAEYIVSCAKGCANQPYVVMDDGWQKNSPPVVGESGRGPWDAAGANFGMEMPEFCRRIAALGAKPGLWYRPLRAWDELPEEQRLIADRDYLDPTVPAVKSRIVEDVRRFREWGFKLVKIDFLSYDLAQIFPCDPLSYYDRYIQDNRKWRNDSRTTAEVMLDLYKAMKDAAGDDVVIIGCNAFSHLAAGVFELLRTGDDTSGRDWDRTRKNGVNTLAMRSIQDGAFFKIDADCVGLVSEGAVPWNLNHQWMELLGRSGTPFFVSWKRELATPEVREALSKAFRHASSVRDVAEPLDWFESRRPRRWRFADGAADFQWSNDFAARPAPRPALAARLAEGPEIIGIVHWGLNTFTDREWGFGDEDPSMLNPAKFDANQIVGACKAGGIGGLVVVAKHHDGFCLWPTKTTEHNITKTPFWKCKVESVKCKTSGDYVKEMEQACRRAGIKFGVYCSPWDRNNAHYGTEKYVTDVFQQQLRELLSGDYGEIFEMWFDGANGGDGYYDGAREKRKIPDGYYRYDTETFAMVRKLQPKVCIFNEMDEADFRFGGNEMGLVDPDSRSTIGHYDGVWDHYKLVANVGATDGTTFHPIEADFPLRKGWFYHESERGTTKSAAYLTKLYLSSVGNASTMNIGIAPNKDGLLDADDVKALAGFKTLKDALFAHEAKSGEPFNVVVMREDISKGEQVDEWEFVADGKAILHGKSIGLKRIRVLETPCTAKSCEVKVLKDGGALQGVSFKLYRADPELVRLVLSSTTESGETDTAKWMTATSDIWQ